MAFLDGPTVKPPTVEEGLLDAIAMSPGDDTPKLVYADFLAERGEPGDCEREEFIRLQTARNEPTAPAPRELELLRMQYKGRKAGPTYHNWKAWARCPKMNWHWGLIGTNPWIFLWMSFAVPLDGIDHGSWWIYRKGFISQVACTWDHWLQFGDTLTLLEPIHTVDLAIFFGHYTPSDAAENLNVLSSRWPNVRDWTMRNGLNRPNDPTNTLTVGEWKLDIFAGGFRAVRND